MVTSDGTLFLCIFCGSDVEGDGASGDLVTGVVWEGSGFRRTGELGENGFNAAEIDVVMDGRR
jgi:hypothetical protein